VAGLPVPFILSWTISMHIQNPNQCWNESFEFSHSWFINFPIITLLTASTTTSVVLTRFYRTTYCMRLQYEPRQCSPISVWRTRVKTAKISSNCFHRLFFGPIALGVERLSPTKLVLMIGDVIRERLFLLLCSKWRTVECHLSSRKLRIHKQMIACA